MTGTGEHVSRLIAQLPQSGRDLPALLIFKKLQNQLVSRINFLTFLILLFRKEHPAFDIDQRCRHHHELTGRIQVLMIHPADIIEVLIRYFRDRNIVNINFVLINEVKEQVERTFKYLKLHGNGQ